MATIVFRGSADIPSVDTVWIPGAPISWSFVDKDFGARRSKWSAVIVEVSIELGFS